MASRLTTEEWVERAKSVWGGRYDYSQSEYKNAKSPVLVICTEEGHGGWWANPDNHIAKKRGCPECGGSKRKTFDAFKTQAIEVHGNHYSYPDQLYKNAFTKVRIECPKHGEFTQRPDAHLRGHGCRQCRDEASRERQVISKEEMNERLLANCGDTFPKVYLVPGSYSGMNSKASIVCDLHGVQEPRLMTSTLTSPHPCIECSGTSASRGRTTEEFMDVLREEFRGEYEIKEFSYDGKQTPITLVCPKEGHGAFTLQAGSIYRSSGCPKCAYDATLPKRRAALQQSAHSTLDKRKQKWIEKSRKEHGYFYDYSEVIYKDQHTSVLIGCPVHGLRSQTPTTHLNSGCRLCADENLKGLYSERYFTRHPEEKTDGGILYYVRFACGDEVFYKVGITKNSVKNRFSATPKDKVTLEVLRIRETTIYNAWKWETELQEVHGEKFRYRPTLDGANPRDYRIGASECFSQELSEDLRRRYFG